MKKVVFYIYVIMWLCSLSAPVRAGGFAASGSFGAAAQEASGSYTLTLAAQPKGVGTLSGGGTYTANSSVTLTATPTEGSTFEYWKDDEGNVVSKSSSFTYTVPERNVQLTAVFTYNPATPGNPSVPISKHKLTLVSKPSGAGTFNTSGSLTVEDGDTRTLCAYSNDGFRFLRWENAKGEVLSTSNDMTYTMPGANTTLYAVYEYSPNVPSNPGTNAWDSLNGEVIVDDFTSGSLYSAINNTIGGSSNASQVTSITVAGKITAKDFYSLANYSNCSVVDMSRTTGAESVPNWCYEQNSTITEVILPASIERLETGAFYSCPALSSVTLYAVIPPTVAKSVFYEVAEDLVVYVPATSVELYESADFWSDYEILPIQDGVHSLELNLPEECSDGRYKNMTLELTNLKSGQKYKYVVTDRINYVFNNLVNNTRYNASLTTAEGTVLASIDSIAIAGKDVSLTFDNILSLQQLTLKVLAAEGKDVTEQVTVSWFDEKGNYLSQGNTLAAQVEGHNVRASLSLPKSLGVQYLLPADTTYTVQNGGNEIVVSLQELPKHIVTGRVLDLSTDQPVSGVTVTLSQVLNGIYSKALVATTGSKGTFSLEAFVAPTDIRIASKDYVAQNLVLADSLLALATVDLGDVSLKPVTGAVISLNFTYTESVEKGVEAEVQNWYSDYENISYTLYNGTKQKTINSFSVQYPEIVLQEEVDEGDVIQVTATSKTSSFVPVTAGGTVNARNRASVTLSILQLGSLKASYTQTENSGVVAMLYDAKGIFVQQAKYDNGSITFSELKDGIYSLVSMGESSSFNTLNKLSSFAASGLVLNTDYVQNNVEIRSGEITAVKNALVPFFDETKLSYTGTATAFTVNKSSVVAGNYLTLQAKLDFKSLYAGSVSNVELVFNLPEGNSFVANSLMVGSTLTSAQVDNGTVTVALPSSSVARVRFCVIPTASGTYYPNAAVRFTYNGVTVTQPIGTASYEVQDLALQVPTLINKSTFSATGAATGRSSVEIYDGSTVIGKTTALANGNWAAECTLVEPANLSSHNIYAKVTTQQGLEMQTETQSLTYDKNSIELARVHMYHWNPELNKNYDMVFDYQNPTTKAQKYTYYIYNKQFSFTIDFTDNDTTRIQNVRLKVKTGNGTWTVLTPTYDSRKKCWVANGEFGNNYDGNVPKNVAVSYDMITPQVVDESYVEENVSLVETLQKVLSTSTEYSTDLIVQLVDAYTSDTYSEALVKELENKVTTQFTLPAGTVQPIGSAEEGRALIEQLKTAFADSILITARNVETGNVSDILGIAPYAQGVKIGTCDTIDTSTLLNNGYSRLSLSDGSKGYFRVTTKELSIVCPAKDFSALVAIDGDMEADGIRLGANADLLEAARDFDEYAVNKQRKISRLLSSTLEDIRNYQQALEASAATAKQVFSNALTTLKWLGEQRRNDAPVAGQESFEEDLIAEVKADGRIVAGTNAALSTVAGPFSLAVKKLVATYDVIKQIQYGMQDVNTLAFLLKNTPDCSADAERALKLFAGCESAIRTGITFHWRAINADIMLLNAMLSSAEALRSTSGLSFISMASSLGVFIVKYWTSYVFNAEMGQTVADLRSLYRSLKCSVPEETDEYSTWFYSGIPDLDVSIDPSGYVYEGVQSNRLAGVTATCYYKETVADMYGDLSENVVLWDAEEYAQENPLFTDEQGGYRWDVPEGLWQVKFEKEGYQTTYSDWLPVPPPQLEINIGMVQNAQPEVKSAKAYEEDVEIAFSKYMNVETLTADNIKLKVITGDSEKFLDDVAVNASDAETEEGGTYASTVALTTAQDLGTVDEVYVIVSKKVQSYAGIQMTEDFTQKLDVEKKVRNIEVDSILNVGYGLTQQVLVAAQPAEASKGKKLTVRSASTLFATVSGDNISETADGVYEVALDENGQATLTVSGEMNGTTALTYSVEDATVTAVSTVNVVDASKLAEVAEVVASYATGSALYRGQTVTLTCETDGATIYYTTDGSCPCESTRLTYERPIAVTDNVTIKAMSVGVNGSESEVKTFTYTIKQSNLQVELAKGWNWMSHNLSETVEDTDLEQEGVNRLLTQGGEVTKDPVLGYVGSLGSVAADEAVKVQTESGLSLNFSGEIYNPTKTVVYLQQGWNWLGYPLDQTMSIGEALANLEVEEGDYITNLTSGYAEYADGAWVGTLATMIPGQGYLYKSVSEKQFVYNNSIVSKAKSLYARRLALATAPWSVDVHQYPSMMCVTANLYDEQTKVEAGAYTVGAFVDGECRGVGSYVGDILFLSIYGDAADRVSFVAVDNETGESYSIQENVVYTPDVLGSVSAPYALTLGTPTAIESVRADGGLAGDVYNVLGQKLQNIRRQGVYVVNGKKVWISNKNVNEYSK